MKVVVFGGAGFLGSYVVDALLQKGHQVRVFDLAPSPWLDGRGEMVLGDIMDPSAVAAALEGVEVVYHFAGMADLNSSLSAPQQAFSLNVMGTVTLLEEVRKKPITRFVYASSAYVFSTKGAFYGTSKKCAELIIEQYGEQYGLPYSIIRYGSVYGERADDNNRLHAFLKEALTKGSITFPGDGSEEREYIHGRDAGKLSVDILDPSYEKQNILLTGHQRFKYSYLLEMIKEILGGSIEIKFNNNDYKGHYKTTQYSFTPRVGVKLINNPCVDFGQGILECLETIHGNIHQED
jgi:UDP-glucose 4-epimerase